MGAAFQCALSARSMSVPLVTIGLTCFNAEKTVGRAIASALAQGWENIEVLVVDDVSTDRSLEAIKAAIDNDARARLIRNPSNLGPAGARNTILENAKGEFVAFFDDDDESMPARISSQINTLTACEKRTGSSLVACYASGIRRYSNGYTIDLPAIGSRGEEAPQGASVADYLLIYRRRSNWFYGTGVPACSLMVRRATFAAVGGFDPGLRRVEDADFAIRLALLGGHFVGTTEPLFIQYSTAAADKTPEKNLEAEQQLADKHREYLKTIRRYYYARQWPKLRYWHFKRNYGRFLMELVGLMIRHPIAVTKHLLATGPRRLKHERHINHLDRPNT